MKNPPTFLCKQLFRDELYSRGDLNIRALQPIHEASWIWHEKFASESQFSNTPRSFRFRKTFISDGTPLILDISADERFILFLDGIIIGRGPDRAAGIENWLYHTYEITALESGEHLLEVVAWTHWASAPLEQLTIRGGLVLKANGAYAKYLDTGLEASAEIPAWEVGELTGTELFNGRGSSWGMGLCVDSRAQGIAYEQPHEWSAAVVVRGKSASSAQWGLRTDFWLLYPTQLRAQLEREITPGHFVCAMEKFAEETDRYEKVGGLHPILKNFDELLKNKSPLTIPPNSAVSLCWDLEDYYSGYPYLETSGGEGAIIEWAWAEALYDENGAKGNRGDFAGKHFTGMRDRFRPGGNEINRFSTQWWRTGKWCELRIATASAPLTIKELHIIESRYPLERESSFAADDPTLPGIEKICTRVMQECAHETLFDGPFYEQQMYPGDTRIQLLTLSLLTQDDRMIRRAIEIFDFGQRDNGMVPMNWPTRHLQESATYTQCWILMLEDYAKYHNNSAWLKARIPALRKALAAFEGYENCRGLLQDLPGWSFIDWDPNWENGNAPSTKIGEGPSAIINLFYVLNLKSAAYVERALGNETMAKYYEEKIPRLKETILELFWDESRGMLADSLTHADFSEHAQCLGIISGTLDEKKSARALDNALSQTDPRFARCTVYFSYYLFEALFKMKRAADFLARLDLWRGYVKQGLATTMEKPEGNGEVSRSDCHAWGSHPLFWMHTGLAGIAPAAPFYKRVKIEPAPGNLSFIKCTTPHPEGFITLDLTLENGNAAGSITLPENVGGEFIWNGKKTPLTSGINHI